MGLGKKFPKKIKKAGEKVTDKTKGAADKLVDKAEDAARRAHDIAEREAREARQRAKEAQARIEREAREAAAKLKAERERIEAEAQRRTLEKAQKAREAAEAAREKLEELPGEILNKGKASLRRLDVKTWPTRADGFKFPEMGDAILERRPNIGLAVSGGGTRSMALSLGYMRALSEQGVLDRTRYIGAISGGSWITVPYVYLPQGTTDAHFLGSNMPARELTVDRLSVLRPEDGLIAKCIAKSELLLPLLSGLATSALARAMSLSKVPFARIRFGLDDVDEQWGRALGGVFLRPFGADGNIYASWRKEHAQAIINRNTNILGQDRLSPSDFAVQMPDRPFLCVNGAMNQDAYLIPDDPQEKWRPLGWRSWEHFEFTPLYSGIHRLSRGAAKLNIGGGYIENVGMDTVFPVQKGDFLRVSPGLDHHRFSPQDMMAISGAAPAYITHGVGPVLRMLPAGAGNALGKLMDVMPKLRNWPIEFNGKPLVRERAFGDGGYVDNYGIVPLLKRKVDKIIVLINTDTALGRHETTVMGAKPQCDTFLHTLFGADTGPSASIGSPSDFLQPGRFLGRENGQVFDEAGLRPLLKGMIANREAGRPTFHRGTYVTRENRFFGIEAGHRCEILWIYNDLFESWYDMLPSQTRALFKGGAAPRRGLAKFPHLPTAATGSDAETAGIDLKLLKAFEQGGMASVINALDRIVDLDSYQVQLAASHSYAVATALRREIADLVGD
ncbi:MAG: hypothetical protein V2J51_13345 [Erythrobacter sp.]|jgi:hypothetical protein|nr:hypothetical protein [Erythrobacter sp.]